MKYAVVTGAYGGMGKETVKLLVENGYVVFALDINAPNGDDSTEIIPIRVDVTDPEDVKNAVEAIKNVTSKLDAVIHFAGFYTLNSLIEISDADFNKILGVNFIGAFYVNKTLAPLLAGGGKIIITTSELAAVTPLPFTGIYAVTKTALDKYAYSLKTELQLLNIDVSVIRAGAVSTDMLGASTDALDKFCANTAVYKCNADRFRKIVNGIESKSVQPSVIAKTALKILSAKKPKFAYNVNRNALLLLYSALPTALQCKILKIILK